MPTTTVVNKTRENYDVYIGRGSCWGNPFVIGVHGDRPTVIARYERWVRGNRPLLLRLGELAGKRLGCYCRPERCHGDVLVKLLEELEHDQLYDSNDVHLSNPLVASYTF